MKTLQIGMGWFPEEAGGLNRYYYNCFHALSQAGVGVQGLVMGSSLLKDEPVQVFAPRDSHILQRWQGIRKSAYQILEEEDEYLVVSHFALYTFPILDQLHDRALVTHFHGPWALESRIERRKPLVNWAKKALEQRVYQRTAQFIVLSHTFCNILQQEYHIPRERIQIIPGGVDLNRFDCSFSQEEAQEKLGWKRDRAILFCIRRLSKRMGLDNLITAIDQVRHHYPEVLLYIAGKGELTSTLQAQIEEMNLQDHVKLLGYLADEELPLAYRAADLSVVPTVALEGFGLVVVESLATGTPVLGTPIGGIPEILQPFCPDLILEGYQPQQLAQGIQEVLGGQRHLPTAQACQNYVKEHYTWSAIAPQIKAVYQAALT
ncbi:glycosyltransferase family 4 protein [Euhalothece natronophila Z-M001]|uniref:Glycosyltransferase family 4 protein n=1 Tax=Euhalothece natronophila Z-M001 TaxID=522448 RepID=A0A5B8NQT6_9CHRO|nr:glycosyltransferase family 4 protein [Euhalothece natronophila Z-M001]